MVLEPKVRKGAAYPLGGEITLGRAPSCAIGLPDDTFASQLHTRVFVADGAVWVEDLGSTNGTYVNGARVSSPLQLASGDRLQIGSTIFEAQ
jgi:pSer/pThr/pTyr-binding forkhead associated (FHA) protein